MLKKMDLSGTFEFAMGKNHYILKMDQEEFHPGQKYGDKKKEDRLFVDEPLPDIFADQIELPSTTEMSGKGEILVNSKETLHLSRLRPFTGKCYYKKSVRIPKSWEGKGIRLTLERTKYTRVFWDRALVSGSHEFLIPQEHLLSRACAAGEHELLIEVDNHLAPYPDFPEELYEGHQFSEHTQTNWNGILGNIYLEALESAWFTEFYKKSDQDGELCISAGISSESAAKVEFRITANIPETYTKEVNTKERSAEQLSTQNAQVKETYFTEVRFQEILSEGQNRKEFTIKLPNKLRCWDEFSPNLYEITVEMRRDGMLLDTKKLRTGHRTIKRQGKTILLNGNPVFLRGNIDCAIFPKTGAAPMEKSSWERLFRILRDYGMNHCRFHSWCPPEEAFEAADEMGIYLQVELSCFAAELNRDKEKALEGCLYRYLENQGQTVLKAYGSHPSFLIFAVGNEMNGELAAFEQLIRGYREVRDDLLFTQGANNFLETPVCSREDDLWVIMRTAQAGGNIRASFSHNDLPLGHIQGKERQNTMHTYEEPLRASGLPLISHEVGQYQVFPDLNEGESYQGTAIMTALNVYRDDLEKTGLLDQAEPFRQACAKLVWRCYKEDIEAILRTPGMSGFQLLSLQDFPGQGTALIGMFNSLWQEKGILPSERWREFCNDTVVMAKMPSYVYRTGDRIPVTVVVCHYGREDICGDVRVRIRGASAALEQFLPCRTVKRGETVELGTLSFDTSGIDKPEQVCLELAYAERQNHYDLWIYPPGRIEPHDCVIHRWDQEAARRLEQGETLVLFSADLENSVEMGFAPDFWCYPMFRQATDQKGLPPAPGTMGLLIDERHPALAQFPTEYFSNWQWQPVAVRSRPVCITDSQAPVHMIVQGIDHVSRNNRLGLLFEVMLRHGRLIVCTCEPEKYPDIPEMCQLYQSILDYALNEG